MWSNLFIIENVILIVSAAICVGVIACGVYIVSRYRIQKRQTDEFVHKYGFVKTQTDDDFLKGVMGRMYWRHSFIDSIPGKMDYKIFTAYKAQFDGEDIYMFDVSSERKTLLMPTLHYLAEMRFILAHTKRKLEEPFVVNIWSNTYGPGSYVYKSDAISVKSLDFGQTIKMGAENPITLTRAVEIKNMKNFYFYGPVGGHPKAYMDDWTLKLIHRAKEKGIAEISYRNGIILFRIFYLGTGNMTGNVVMDPAIPYEHIKQFLKS